MRKKIFPPCNFFAKFLQILNLHTDFRPREESVSILKNVCTMHNRTTQVYYLKMLKIHSTHYANLGYFLKPALSKSVLHETALNMDLLYM